MHKLRVTAAIIIKNECIFIAQRNHDDELSGKWEFPGGKIESTESPQECLRRELLEEFGIESRIGDFLGESIFDHGNKIVHLLGYFAYHISGEFKPVIHQNIKWITADKLDFIDWAPADIKLVELLKKRLRIA